MVGLFRHKKLSEQASGLQDEYYSTYSEECTDDCRHKRRKRSKHRRDGKKGHRFRHPKRTSHHQSTATNEQTNHNPVSVCQQSQIAQTSLLKNDEQVQAGSAPQKSLKQGQSYAQRSQPTKASCNCRDSTLQQAVHHQLESSQEPAQSLQQPSPAKANKSLDLSSAAAVLPIQTSNTTLQQKTTECTVDLVPDEDLRRDTLVKCIEGILSFLDFVSKPAEVERSVEVAPKQASRQKQLKKVSEFVRLTVRDNLNKSDELFKRINRIDYPLPAHVSSDRNPKRCRFDDVHCADHNRVYLHKSHDLYQISDFIHANRVPIDRKRDFILTQLPIKNTVKHFWQLVWQEKVEAILLILTKHEWKLFGENTRLLPTSGSLKLSTSFSIVLNQEFEVTKNVFIKVLYLSVHGYQRKVSWIQYTDWLHDLAPNSSDEVWKIHHLLGKFTGPVICMSLSGIGRAGTYTAIEMLYHRLHNPYVTRVLLEETIQKLREYRMLAIQSSKQLTFIQLAILDRLLSHDEIKAVVDPTTQNLYDALKSSKYKKISTSSLEDFSWEEYFPNLETSGIV